MNQFKKYLSLNLGLLLIAVVAYFYMFEAPKLVTIATKPIAKKELAQRATAINYEGAMIVKELDSIDDIMAELEASPPAGGESFDLASMAKTITAEALKAFSDSDERALPLVTHWNVGESEGMDPTYMMSRIEKGEHILVSWKLDPYYSDTIGNSYYEESIKKAASLKLPLVFVLPAPESALTKDSYYRGLDKTENPNVVNASGKILNKLSPFGPDALWNEIGEQWSSTSLMAQLQEWYPNPPLVVFVSEDEAAKLSWDSLSESSRYTQNYPSGKDDNYKRTLLGAKWIEKYRQMHEGFKQGFSKSAWKNNVKFVSYNNFSDDLGKTNDWVKESTLTNQYVNVWPLTADGATLNFDLSGSKTDASANAPHILANNLPFMINEAKAKNPNFAYQLNLNANSKVQDAAQYRGLTQFALWFLRPSTIRQASSERGVESLEPLFQEVADSVELIHYNDSLADFWKNGTLVSSGESDLNANVPEQYKNDPRWFLLDTDKNPKRPWANNDEISVWAFALVKGEAPNREWLVYVQSPTGDKTGVKVTIPDYKDILVDSSLMGSFYTFKENKDVAVINQAPSQIVDIPVMNIIKRSDWIDVRDMGAKGDGVTDDTQAIQDSFDALKTDKTKSGVYFPEGTFNISSTLQLGGSMYGKTIIGHGRNTILKWVSSSSDVMLKSNGISRTVINGLSWDGNNIATIGFWHRSTTIYEGQVIHKNESFKNFTQSGIEVYGGSSSGDLAAAEVLISNSLFDNTNIGINIGTDMYNAYDWVIDKCEIRNNQWGIKALKGQFFVYNTHFSSNYGGDIWSENGSYIRRVTSENSNMFYKDILGSSSGQGSTFEDVHVANWTANDGIALNYGYRGSMLMFDSSFTNSPSSTSSPVYLQGRTGDWTQNTTFFNTSFDGNSPLYDKSRNAKFVDIPSANGTRNISSASQTFLNTSTITETKIIEVTGNDDVSIQIAIDKAVTIPNSVVYLPLKNYIFKNKVNIYGSDYSIEGSGVNSRISYDTGVLEAIYLQVNNVSNVKISNMMFELDNGEIGIYMDSDSQVSFDQLRTQNAGSHQEQPLFVFQDLSSSSIINLGFNDGKINMDNVSNATILAKMHLGNISLSGNTGTGFIGFRWLNAPNINIQDSLNMVIGDFYTEQYERIFDFSGKNGDKKGRITIGGGQKIHAYNKIDKEYAVFDNYNGDIIFMQGNFVRESGNKLASEILLEQVNNGDNLINLILLGAGFSNYSVESGNNPYIIDIKKGSKYILQSTVVANGEGKKYDIEDSSNISDAFSILEQSFQDLRNLGMYDIKY